MAKVLKVVSCFHLVVGLMLVIFGCVDRFKNYKDIEISLYIRYIVVPVWTGFLVSLLGTHYRCFSFKHASVQ